MEQQRELNKDIFQNIDIDKIILDESGILSFNWFGEENFDFQINIDWNGQYDLKDQYDFNKIETKLLFINAFDFNLNLKSSSGIHGTIGIEYFKYLYSKERKCYDIEFKFDFSAEGSLKFSCYDFSFIIQKTSS